MVVGEVAVELAAADDGPTVVIVPPPVVAVVAFVSTFCVVAVNANL